MFRNSYSILTNKLLNRVQCGLHTQTMFNGVVCVMVPICNAYTSVIFIEFQNTVYSFHLIIVSIDINYAQDLRRNIVIYLYIIPLLCKCSRAKVISAR